MDEIVLHDKRFVKFISHREILEAVRRLAERVADDAGEMPVFVAVLKGGFVFASDFAKAYRRPAVFDFIRVKSYKGTASSGEVEVLLDVSEDLQGKEVYVLEDIVDTGQSLEKIVELLSAKNPKSLKTVALFFKPEAYRKDIPVDYKGIVIPNKFIVGYGLDYNELGRNLPDVYQLKT
ncbi:MAG: hypoxanthine phosphoribosyltransferase [Chlorobi bacterium]|nr:hypoxanthine phosphoribosyltransferase [Chlorobiota bacterium]